MITEKQKTKAIKMRLDGYTLAEISEKLRQKSLMSVCFALKAAGVKRPFLRHTLSFYEKPNRERDRQICAWRKKGATYREIGEVFGVSRQRAYNIVNGKESS